MGASERGWLLADRIGWRGRRRYTPAAGPVAELADAADLKSAWG